MRILMAVATLVPCAMVSAQWCRAQESRQVFTEAHYPGGVTAMAFSPDGKRLVSVGRGGEVQLRDLSSERTHDAKLAPTSCVAFHPGGKIIAAGGRDGTITLWDAASARSRTTLKGHIDRVWALSFSSNGKLLISASSDKTVRVWDVDKAREKATLRHAHWVYQVAFFKRDKLLVSGSDAVRAWDVDSATEIAVLKKKGSDEISLLAVSPDGKTVAFAVNGERIKPQLIFWDISVRQQRPGPDLEGHIPSSLTFSPDGTMLAVGIPDSAVVWSVGDGQKKAVLAGHYGPPEALTFSPDGGTLASGDCEGTIRLWDMKSRLKEGKLPDRRWIVGTWRSYKLEYGDFGEWKGAAQIELVATSPDKIGLFLISADGERSRAGGSQPSIMDDRHLFFGPVGSGLSFRYTRQGDDLLILDLQACGTAIHAELRRQKK